MCWRVLEGRRRNQWGGKDWLGEEDLEPERNRIETWLAGGGGSQLGLQNKRVFARGVQESSVNTHRLPCV